jgi:hypothetical protein
MGEVVLSEPCTPPGSRVRGEPDREMLVNTWANPGDESPSTASAIHT